MYSVDFILLEKNGFTLAPIFLLSVMSLSVILHLDSWISALRSEFLILFATL